MSEHEHHHQHGEEAIDESGRNPTQQQIDERGASDAPADADQVESPAENPDAAVSGDAA